MSFLPNKYQMPVDSNYMRFEKGSNKFRVLDSAIVGFEWWVEDEGKRKPMRTRTFGEAVQQGNEPIKHFWAFPVWNYKASKVQILEVTQKTIMSAMTSLVDNEDWGDPKDYDITVTRDGDGFDTEYALVPSPHKPMMPEVLEAQKNLEVRLEALYEGNDPFTSVSESEIKEALK